MNYMVKHVTEGIIQERIVTVRRRRRYKQLLDDLKEKRVCCKLKNETLDRTL
jgi:hypothetical protein